MKQGRFRGYCTIYYLKNCFILIKFNLKLWKIIKQNQFLNSHSSLLYFYQTSTLFSSHKSISCTPYHPPTPTTSSSLVETISRMFWSGEQNIFTIIPPLTLRTYMTAERVIFYCFEFMFSRSQFSVYSLDRAPTLEHHAVKIFVHELNNQTSKYTKKNAINNTHSHASVYGHKKAHMVLITEEND